MRFPMLLPLLVLIVAIVVYKQWSDTQFEYRSIVVSNDSIHMLAVEDYPKVRAKSVSFFGVDTLNQRFYVTILKDSLSVQMNKGDLLLIKSDIKPVSRNEAVLGFDFNKYLIEKRVLGTMFVAPSLYRKIGSVKNSTILDYFTSIRQSLLLKLSKVGLSDDEFAIASALILGSKEYIRNDVRADFAASGAMHILALSGLHIMVISAILMLPLYLLRKFRTLFLFGNIVVILLLWCYALLTGLSPSVARAVLMITLYTIGKLIGRETNSLNILFASAFIWLLINPLDLFSAGFQLSYMAVLAILIFTPCVDRYIPNNTNKILSFFIYIPIISIIAQLGTAPLSIYYFNLFPTYFLLTNFVAIPLLYLILFSVPFTLVLYPQLLSLLISLLLGSIEWISSLPYAKYLIYFDIYTTVLAYIAIFFVYLYIRQYNVKYLIVSICIMFFTTSLYLYKKHNRAIDNELIIENKGGKNIVLNVQNGFCNIYARDTLLVADDIKLFLIKHSISGVKSHHLDSNDIKGFIFNNKKYLIITGNPFKNKRASNKLEADFIIAGDKYYPQDYYLKYFIDLPKE